MGERASENAALPGGRRQAQLESLNKRALALNTGSPAPCPAESFFLALPTKGEAPRERSQFSGSQPAAAQGVGAQES